MASAQVPGRAARGDKVIVVMPAYNAAKTLRHTYEEIPPDVVDEVILVDDVSRDETVAIAESLQIRVVVHLQNRGYGGNQKTCYIEALLAGADIVVMLHPDHQYDSSRVPELVRPILTGEADFVLGSRIATGAALAGGMPVWKFVANRCLTLLENLILGTHATDLHTGFRAYSRRVLTTIPFLLNSDGFVFDSQVIAQANAKGFRIAEVPVPARYFAEASSVGFRVSLIYGLGTVKAVLQLALFKLGLWRAAWLDRTLYDVLSPHHRDRIFSEARASG